MFLPVRFSRPQNEALKSGLAETLWANRQNVGKVSPDIFSLPFIRNHDFARNSTKGFIFKAFRAFSEAFHEMRKKETVNSSLKNTNLCLCLGLVHFILTNHFCGESLFLWLQRRAFWGVKWSGTFWPRPRCSIRLAFKSGVGPKDPHHFRALYGVGIKYPAHFFCAL